MTKKALTKLEKEKQKKKELNESLEYLRQVENLPTEEGRKFVIDDIEEDNKKEQKLKDDILTDLQEDHDRQFTYRSALASYGQEKLEKVVPSSWLYGCIATDGSQIKIFNKTYQSKPGVLFILKSPKGNVYTRGIFTTMDPEYDINAVDILVVQAENTIDSEKGILLSDNKDTEATLKKTKSGIVLP